MTLPTAIALVPRRPSIVANALVVGVLFGTTVVGGEGDRSELREPVYRVTRSTKTDSKDSSTVQPKIAAEPVGTHPLDPAIKMAHDALQRVNSEIRDYTGTMIKQERVDGALTPTEYMDCKIRNRQMKGDQIVVPFSVYLKFRKPAAMKGREVIYVEQRNNGKMVVREGGLKGRILPTVWLNPQSRLAMRGNRYPVTEIGIETLTRRLIEKGTRDRNHGECDVQFFKNATINRRSCTCLQVMHPVRRSYFDFHLARIFMDNELGVPTRYEAYDWPATEGGEPQLTEAYTYLNLKLNVGLTDADFDHKNPAYNF